MSPQHTRTVTGAPEIARILERSEVNARQLVTRARKHLGPARRA